VKVEIRRPRVVADLAVDMGLLAGRLCIGREQRLRIREGNKAVDVVDLRLLDLDGAALVLSLPREGELAAHVLARDLGLRHRAAEDLDAVRQRAVRQQRQDVHDVEPRELRVEDLALLAVGARDFYRRTEAVRLG